MEHIGDQLRAFAGVIGATIAAWVGMWAKHATDPNGFSWKRLWLESPVAILCGIMAGALGDYFGLSTLVTYGIASSVAYASPNVVFQVLRKRLEKDDGKTS